MELVGCFCVGFIAGGISTFFFLRWGVRQWAKLEIEKARLQDQAERQSNSAVKKPARTMWG